MPVTDGILKLLEALQHSGATVRRQSDVLSLDYDSMSSYSETTLTNLLDALDEPSLLLPAALALNGEITLNREQLARCTTTPMSAISQVLESFGVAVSVTSDSVCAKTHFFKPSNINLQDYLHRQWQDTEKRQQNAALNLSMIAIITAAAVTLGASTVQLPIRHPVVDELLTFLKAGGYRVARKDLSVAITPPRKAKNMVSFNLRPNPSNIFAYVTAATFFNIPLVLRNVPLQTVKQHQAEKLLLERMGLNIVYECNSMYIPVRESVKLSPMEIDLEKTGIHPNHLAFFALMLNRSQGPSYIRPWPAELNCIMELAKLGLRLEIANDVLRINPTPPYIKDKTIHCRDENAAMATMLAGLRISEGTTIIDTTPAATSACKSLHAQLHNIGFESEFCTL